MARPRTGRIHLKVDSYLIPGPLSGVVEEGRRAVDLGYDGVFTTDTSHDPFLPLAEIARVGSEIEIGTAIAVAFARSPMTVAQSAWDLTALSGGRFLLGLGTQVRAHVTRRFSMPWDRPGPRMREFIQALRAIWDTWQNASPLRFKGDFYQFSLMTPFFDPGPVAHPEVPIYLAAVGPYMCRLAGELCQGLHVHPFHTVRYLDEVVLPEVSEGAAASGRTLGDVERAATVFVVTGRDEDAMQTVADAVKSQIAFYASTPSYAPVLDVEGWDFGPELSAMARRGRWAEMGAVIDDEVVNAVAVVAPVEELGVALRERYGDRLQRVGYYLVAPPDLDDEGWMALIDQTKG